MAGDYSRDRFKPLNDFSAVLNQQGRVQLDADWNELNAIIDRRIRAETVDIAGRCWVPDEVSFSIKLAGVGFTIGPGRIYVDGLLAENHGWMPSPGVVLTNYLKFDPVLAEETGTLPIPHDRQPYLPVTPLLPKGGPCLVYIDVWQREVTYIEDGDLIEQAVGVDTTTRKQTAWQVRAIQVPAGSACGGQISVWDALTTPSAGQLSTAAVGVSPQQDPCIIPPSGGYRGLENHLYRVEIHDRGPLGFASFKWSRDNASMVTNVTAIPAQDTLTVVRTGRDSVMRFNPGDWVEIKDDWLELTPPTSPTAGPPPAQPGSMRQIKDVTDATSTITLYPDASQPTLTTLFPPVDAQGNLDSTRHTRIIRWDQKGKIFDSNGNLIVDLDAAGSKGVIPVPSNSTTSVMLEQGIQVTFAVDFSIPFRLFHIADYWTFAARTADASIETLQNAPPIGVHHHYCRLALVSRFPGVTPASGGTAFTLPAAAPATLLSDCRCVFSPVSPTILDFVSPGECQYVVSGTGIWADALDENTNVPRKEITLKQHTGATVVIPINPILRSTREKRGSLLDGARVFYEILYEPSGLTGGAVSLALFKASLPLQPNGTPITPTFGITPVPSGPSKQGAHTLAVSMGTALSIASNEAAHMQLNCSAATGIAYAQKVTVDANTTFRFLGALLEYGLPRCETQKASQ
jgi:hypothetical protein